MKVIIESTREKVAIGATAAVVLAAIVVASLWYSQKSADTIHLTSEVQKLDMSVHDRVVNVVTDWARVPSRPGDSMPLEAVWSAGRQGMPYYSEAAQLLEAQMRKEFRESRTPVMRYSDLNDPKLNPNGNVTTVGELSRLVRANYVPE